jgi:hypothetical protein
VGVTGLTLGKDETGVEACGDINSGCLLGILVGGSAGVKWVSMSQVDDEGDYRLGIDHPASFPPRVAGI